MSPALLDNVYSYSFSWYTTRNKKYSSFISAYGIPPVSKVCKFNVNAHIYLGGH
jgi:hypothetical protein